MANNLTSGIAHSQKPSNSLYIMAGQLLHVTIERAKWMLALLLVCFMHNASSAQINDEYRFVQYNVPDQNVNSSSDTVVNLTMDCLAANGYGQWTASSQTNSPVNANSSWIDKGWFLLGNRIETSSNGQGTPQPETHATGVVSKGRYTGMPYPAHMKVTANLEGRVRYVWPTPDPNRTSFIVQGLNDQRHADPTQRQIDISFNGFPNPPINRQAVKQLITSYQNVPTNVISTEQEWADEFDVASDKNFLYIVWSTPTNVGGPGVGRDVWATVRNLGDLSPVAGYPILITNDAYRPTVACDVRSFAGATPKFSIGCIGATLPANHNVQLWTVSGIAPTIVKGQIPIQPQFRNPNAVGFTPFASATYARVVVPSISGSASPQIGLYAIVYGGNGINHLIFYENAPADLIAQYVDGVLIPPAAPLAAIAGPNPPGYPIWDKPIIAFANPYDAAQNIYDATVNQFHVLYQYDGLSSIIFVQRRPLIITRSYHSGQANPLSPNMRLCLNVNSGISEDDVPGFNGTYTPVALRNDDPSSYVGAVNQMGIHIHWRTTGDTNKHFYSRDINRTFDENIEENTLVTNDCRVTDGSARSNGTLGAKLNAARTMTVWTDPNWGKVKDIPNTDLFDIMTTKPQLHDRGKLIFRDSSVTLDIGTPNQTTNLDAKLVTLSHFLCVFQKTNQTLRINPVAVWDFLSRSSSYISSGINETYSGFFADGTQTPFVANSNNLLNGGGKTVLAGKAVSADTNRAILNLHGGTDFLVANGTVFDANLGKINSLFESSVFPTNIGDSSDGSTYWAAGSGDYKNGPEIGKMTITGQAKIYNSVVESFFKGAYKTGSTTPTLDPLYYHTLTVKPGWTGTTGYQFDAQKTVFKNATTAGWNGNPTLLGYASIGILGNSTNAQYQRIRFDQCTLKNAPLLAMNTVKPFTITASSFTMTDSIHNWGSLNWVDFFRGNVFYMGAEEVDSLFLDYTGILIDGCTFKYGDDSNASHNMIQFTGFDKRHIYTVPPSTFELNRILISDNNLSTSVEKGGALAAISLFNSSAAIIHNTIIGVHEGCFESGISCQSDFNDPITSSTFICSNNIQHCDFGIITSFWKGYSKLNEIHHCYEGHFLGQGVQKEAGILFNNIHDNKIGLRLFGNASIDLAGVHSTLTNNYAANNTFENNNNDTSDIKNPGGQIMFDSTATGEIFFAAADTSLNVLNTKAQNNFIRKDSTDNYIYFYRSDTSTSIKPINKTLLHNKVSNNYFITAGDTLPDTVLTPEVNPFWKVSFSTSTGNPTKYTYSNIYCGSPSGIETKDKATEETLSMLDHGTPEECDYIYLRSTSLAQGGQYQKAYDTLKYFVEHCTNIMKTYGAFSSMNGSNQDRSNDPNRYPEHLAWLKKVLYYDPDPIYYCEDAYSMFITLRYFDSVHGNYYEGKWAILRYLLDSAHCGHMRETLQRSFDAVKDKLCKKWRDTVTDSLKTPCNPRIPSLEELDLTILRGKPNNSATEPTAKPTERIISFTAARNPFGDEVSLSAELSASTMLHLAVFDELGREMYSEGLGFKQAGEYSYRIPAKGWSSGVYYARLSTSGGEVRTVKLVKQ